MHGRGPAMLHDEMPPTIKSALEQPSLNLSLPAISKAYQGMREIVERHYPALWPQLHAYLATTASLCWSDFPLPVTMIAMGPSGSGKTEPLSWIMRSGLEGVVRSDFFTSKSFVTHASNIKKEKLAEIDLLPKLRDACLCTKELAPLFSGREDDLRVAFAQLTSVLDGEGLVTSSGTQGTRGYPEPVNFCWLGATTPPRPRVFALMAALGTRLFFFSTDCGCPHAADYAALIRGAKRPSVDRAECAEVVREFLKTLFSEIPRRSLSIDEIGVHEEIAASIGLYCEALTLLRGGLSLSDGETMDDDRHGAPAIEHGWRAAQVMRALTVGSALIRGERSAGVKDMQFVRRVCLSSMPEYRRLVFEAVLGANGRTTGSDVAKRTSMAKRTALHHLRALAVLGIVEAETDFEPFRFTLKEEFHPLLEHTPTSRVTPSDQHNRISGNTLTMRNYELQGVTQNDGACNESVSKPPSPFPEEGFVPEADLPEGF